MKQGNPPSLGFVGIGFTRCGTTWVHNCLDGHPETCMPRPKETNFFLQSYLEADTLYKYQRFFRSDDGKVRGKVNPRYVVSENACKTLKRFYPNIKIFVLLRNPVERAISAFLFRNRYRKLEPIDINRALKRYKSSDMYSKHLHKWLSAFPRDQLFVGIFEEMIEFPEASLKTLQEFLRLDYQYVSPFTHIRVNARHVVRFPETQKALRAIYKKVILNATFRNSSTSVPILENLKYLFHRINKKEQVKINILPDTREYLKEIFEPEVNKMEGILGREILCWK